LTLTQWLKYSTKGGGSLFSEENSNTTGDMYTCVSVTGNRKVPDLYFKVVDPKLQVVDVKAEWGS